MRGLRAGSGHTTSRRWAAWRWAATALLLCIGIGLATEAPRAQTRAREEEGPRDPNPVFDRREVEEMQRQRADALRRNIEIEHDLRRLETNRVLRRQSPTRWNLWY
ncbi:MAG: hypothetical protein JRH16_08855 [Deltaproteobacteria bacterium]|nr:hypothetical protein [Deltaproteobacteria bacterium]MBW2363291.1 hypothetical protein [Deltaproteobacteria bacterium]